MSGIFDQIINYSPPLIVSGTVNYKGTWDASANSPTLNASPAASTKGDYYVVSTAGTQFGITFAIGDWIISNGTAWEKVDLTDAVSSVFGRTGAVVGVSTDYSAVGITNTAIGASSPSTGAFTTVSASTPIAVASGGTGVSTSTGTTNVVLSNSPTIVTPVIAQINDASGNETLKLASIASAVNEISIENAATGNPVHIRATGGDASVGLHLVAKGASGYVNVTDGVDETKRLMFNAAGGTTNTRTMLSSTQTVDRTISLPDATDTLVGKATTDTLTNKTLTSPTLTTPILGTPQSATLTNATGLPISTGVSGLGTGIATALAVNTGSAGAPVLFNGALGTPTSGTVTNLTGTASININGTVGATTRNTVAATTGNFQASGGAPIILTGNSSAQIQLGGTGATDPSIRYDAAGVLGVVTADQSAYAKIRALDFNGTVGATTASTGAFTTLSASGTITSNPASGDNVNFQNGAGVSLGKVFNDSGFFNFQGSANVSGTRIEHPTQVQNRINGATITTTNSTGLAVTGALSSTTGANFATSSGSVGIGTSSPRIRLEAVGTDSAESGTSTPNGGIMVSNPTASNSQVMTMGVVNGASNHSWIQSRNSTSANFYSLVLNPSGGNVGIGATSPAAKLHVRSSSSSVVELLRLDNSGNAADNGAKITWANADQAYDAGYISVIRNASLLSQDMVFATSSNWTTTAPSEKVRITGAGNVGIGTTSPGAKLEVAGGDLRVNGTGTGNIGITLKRTAGTTSDWYQYIPSGSDAFVWFQGGVGAERMRIDSSGNLLVGTTSAGTNLKGLQASNTTSTQWPLYTTAVDRGLIVVMSASDGIASYFITNSTTNVGSITCTSSATSYNTSSDYRRKSNVQDLTGSGSFIDALKPRTFDWDTGDKGVGFIAHEFAEVSPSSVHGKKDAVDSDGKPVYQAMQASSAEVIANLVAELQSVRQRLAALETR